MGWILSAVMMRNSKALIGFSLVCGMLGIYIMFHSQRRAGERATHATVRTVWSTPEEAKRQEWLTFHAQLVAEARRYKHNSSRAGIVLIGDSIFERLRGTSYGRFK